MPSTSDFNTADLSDTHRNRVVMIALDWRSFGGRGSFSGPVATLRTRDDHGAVRATLERPGGGRVLVIDAAGDRAIAMLGDRFGAIAAANGWAGIVVNGVVRDSRSLATIDLGILALGTTAMRSFTTEPSHVAEDVLDIAGVIVRPNDWLYADPDAVLVSRMCLSAE